MPAFVELISEKIDIAAGVKVIKAGDYSRYLEAEAIIAAAEKKAESIIQQAEAAYEAEKQRGFKEGIEQGKKEQSAALIDTLSKCEERYQQMAPELVEIVLTTVRQIMGQFDSRELTGKLVEQALQQHKCNRVVFRVHPDNVAALNKQLEAIRENHPDISYVSIEKDALVEKTGCILETDLGNVQADLDTQLEALQQSAKNV